MAKPKEPDPSRATKIRAGLPGEKWRKHVSAGSEKAYDYPLANQREEAKALRKKGRLIAAHRTEKASYKIRARGYDRKARGVPEIEKAWTRDVTRIGPYVKSKQRLSLLPKNKAERRNDTIKAVGQSLGGLRTVVALGGGAGIAATVKDKSEKAKEIGMKVTRVSSPEQPVKKGLDIDSINKSYLPMVRPNYDIDLINKAWSDDEYELYLEEIAKFALGGALGSLGGRYGKAAFHGFSEGGWQGAKTATQKVAQRTGGLQGASEAAQNTWNAGGTGTKAALGAAGAAGLGYGAYRMAKPLIKRKAKKAALYTGLGVGGTIAGGVALGNAVSGRR